MSFPQILQCSSCCCRCCWLLASCAIVSEEGSAPEAASRGVGGSLATGDDGLAIGGDGGGGAPFSFLPSPRTATGDDGLADGGGGAPLSFLPSGRTPKQFRAGLAPPVCAPSMSASLVSTTSAPGAAAACRPAWSVGASFVLAPLGPTGAPGAAAACGPVAEEAKVMRQCPPGPPLSMSKSACCSMNCLKVSLGRMRAS